MTSRARAAMSLWIGLALLVLGGRGARADCPEATFHFLLDTPYVPIYASVFDTTVTTQFTRGHAGFDLAAGTAHFDVDSDVTALFLLLMRDTYVIEGPASGTPCAVHVAVHLTGTLLRHGLHSSAAFASTELRVGTAPQADVFVSSNGPEVPTPFDRTIFVDVVVPAGVPFTIENQLEGGASISGQAAADVLSRLVVTAVDGEGHPVSCHGYGAATPAESRSWGALKALYR
jgi:hypothetical protein